MKTLANILATVLAALFGPQRTYCRASGVTRKISRNNGVRVSHGCGAGRRSRP